MAELTIIECPRCKQQVTAVWRVPSDNVGRCINCFEVLMHAVRALAESTQMTGDEDAGVKATRSKKAAEVLFDLVRSSDEHDEIPQDADLIRADFVSDSVLTVSWYGNPKDAPEWWGKDLGFSVVVGDGNDDVYYGKRVADVINELAQRLTVEKCRVECADECSKNSADRVEDLERALRRLVQKARRVHITTDDDAAKAAHEFDVALDLAEGALGI